LVGVRNGHVVFACNGRVRATVTASWYRQMGFPNVYAVDGGTSAWVAAGLALAHSQAPGESGGYDEGLQEELPFGYEPARARVESLSAAALQACLQSAQPPVVLYVDTSREFSNGHVPGAQWVPRGWLELRIGEAVPNKATPLVVTCADGRHSVLAGATLQDLGYQQVAVLSDGMPAWRQAGLPLEKGLSGVMSPPTDVLAMGTDRNWADAMHYLRWEEELGKKYATQHT
jgi:rhodanese-related sulfurtransferase